MCYKCVRVVLAELIVVMMSWWTGKKSTIIMIIQLKQIGFLTQLSCCLCPATANANQNTANMKKD